MSAEQVVLLCLLISNVAFASLALKYSADNTELKTQIEYLRNNH